MPHWHWADEHVSQMLNTTHKQWSLENHKEQTDEEEELNTLTNSVMQRQQYIEARDDFVHWQAIFRRLLPGSNIKAICSGCWVSCVLTANGPLRGSNEIEPRPPLLRCFVPHQSVTVVFTYAQMYWNQRGEMPPCFRTTSQVRKPPTPPRWAEWHAELWSEALGNVLLLTCQKEWGSPTLQGHTVLHLAHAISHCQGCIVFCFWSSLEKEEGKKKQMNNFMRLFHRCWEHPAFFYRNHRGYILIERPQLVKEFYFCSERLMYTRVMAVPALAVRVFFLRS